MNQDTKNQITPDLLTTTEVMNKLKIGRTTLWNLTKERGVKTVKVGGSIRYTPEAVAQLIDN